MKKKWVPLSINGGGRIKLRPIDPKTAARDADQIVALAQDQEVMEALKFFSFFQKPVTQERQIVFFARMNMSASDQLFVIETETGQAIGTCGLHDIDRFNDNLRLGIIIFDKNYWGKGYGKEVLRLLLGFSFAILRMNKVYLTARVDNERAVHIYKKLGFVEEGVLRQEYRVEEGRYIDLLRMSILREQWRDASAFWIEYGSSKIRVEDGVVKV